MPEAAFPIVGIGASAGGVEALSTLLTHIPPEPGAAFVIVTHLAADRVSLLPEILGRCTAMPLASAVNGGVIRINHVYLIPPGMIMTVADNRLVLTPRTEERNPTDILLASLAIEGAERAVAVILSGSGTDGAIGLKAVREAGGFTIAQAPDANPLAHHGMPDAAIATGFVDCVLPLEQIGERLAAYIVATHAARDHSAAAEQPVSDAPFAGLRDDLYDLLRHRVGHDFSGYKWSTVLRRLQRRMHVCRIDEPAAYIAFLKTDPAEADLLFRDLLIGVTSFFRDIESFDELATRVLPQLFKGKGAGDVIRVWVPGCATGEEAYSIAMLLSEVRERMPGGPRLQIFATDVDDRALAVARFGRYPAKLLEGMQPARLQRFFTREGENYAVAKAVRDICLFSCHSLVRDPPFSRIDLISCRNLLIYFTADLQNKVIPLFHYALRDNGYLFLGASEHASQHESLFTPLDKRRRIFQRRAQPGRPTIFPVAILQANVLRQTGSGARIGITDGQGVVAAAQQRMLDRFVPAHVIVNGDSDIIHYSGGTGKYLEPPSGAPGRNVMMMARNGLGVALRSAMQEVSKTGHAAERHGVMISTIGGTQAVDLIVETLPKVGDGSYRVIVFHDVGSVRARDASEPTAGQSDDRDDAFVQIEQELRETRDQLHTTIEEYGTSVEELKSANEELLSVNEELQSANEELETSKEELQSVNEELYTVNGELESKITELDKTTDDLRNFVESTQIATIFLDAKLIIRRFTPATTEVFELVPSDVGRSLLNFVTFLDYDGLADDVHAVLQSGVAVEKQLAGRGRQSHYLMRILPYRTTDSGIDGVVITFVNVTSLVRLGEQQLLVAELNHRVKNTLAIVTSIATRMARQGGTLEDFMSKFAIRMEGLARTHNILSTHEWTHVGLHELIIAELSAFADSARFSVQGPAVRLLPQSATAIGIVIHELSTNASKYGAFSNDLGKVAVGWSYETREGSPWLVIRWQESGGPPVCAPTRRGFGTDVIERSAAHEFGGTAELNYLTDGVLAILAMPASEVTYADVEPTPGR